DALDQLPGVSLPVGRVECAREIIGQRAGRAVEARGNRFDDNANEGSDHEKSRRVRANSSSTAKAAVQDAASWLATFDAVRLARRKGWATLRARPRSTAKARRSERLNRSRRSTARVAG